MTRPEVMTATSSAPRPSASRTVAILLWATTLTGVMLSGCVSTRVEHSKNARTGIAANESVAVLARSYHKGNTTEEGFLDCLADELDDGQRSLRVMNGEAFVDALYPWFEPRTMPQEVTSLPDILARPGVSQAIERAGVRYIVWVDGKTETTNQGGGLSCAASPGGAACFGLMWWENAGEYEASVWDLRNGVASGEVSSDARGTSMVPAIIIPVPLIARTQTAACKNLASELKTFIRSEGAT
jgi:hypothetical protein